MGRMLQFLRHEKGISYLLKSIVKGLGFDNEYLSRT